MSPKTLSRSGLLIAAVVGAYLPALQGGFIWDDDAHVTSAALSSFSGLCRIWTQIGATQQYYPVLHTAFWVEHHLWSDAPLGYHLINVAWHAVAAILFAFFLGRIWPGPAQPEPPLGAWFAAFLFALHPVCVESVAWISEQKNTLSIVFYLGAAVAYLSWEERRGGWRYGAATGLFGLALLTKSVTATLPAALLVLAWLRRGRIVKGDLVALAPWLTAALTMGACTVWVERVVLGASGSDYGLSALERVLLAGRVLWFYLGKLFWPFDLVFIYPHWAISSAAAWPYAFPIVFVILLCLLARRARQGSRAPLAALLCFAGTLFPALGFFNVYPFIFSYVADHFQYLASLAVFALIGAAWEQWRRRNGSLLPAAAAFALVGMLSVLTWRQCRNYRDAETLYRSVLAANPQCWMADYNLGVTLQQANRVAEAAECYAQAIRLRTQFPQPKNNLAVILLDANRAPEAIPLLESAIAEYGRNPRLGPFGAEAEGNLGRALQQDGRDAEATPHFERALAGGQDRQDLRNNYAVALIRTGRFVDAARALDLALELHPDDATARENRERLRRLLAR